MCGFTVYTGSSKWVKLNLMHDFFQVKHRGPDNTNIVDLEKGGWMGFHRLMIIDISNKGNQPLVHNNLSLVCNGEIYNYKEIKRNYKLFPFKSDSDCEVIIPLFIQKGIIGCAENLDGEFAFVIHDSEKNKYYAGRDPIGIRPMFYGYTEEGHIAFASEMKTLNNICINIKPFPPGHVYDGEKFVKYIDVTKVNKYFKGSFEEIFDNIRELLTRAVEKRLQSDVPVGFLLSGGLDSSLVCSIASKLIKEPIKTFSVGIDVDPIDTRYAKIVADYLRTDHTEVIFTKHDVLNILSKLIYHLETWDITTIRASIGMYIVCKYISENTDVKVLLTGEVSDELFGYKYTDFAPSPEEFQKEAAKRIKELYMYDVLRADRCISANGLEARVPFSDTQFVQFIMSIPPEKKMNFTGIGKYLLRKSFEGDYLPNEILYREKAAFSDAVGHSMVDFIKAYADDLYTYDDLLKAQKKYKYFPPISKEALLYRNIFEKYFPGRAQLIKSYWMPNKEWPNCNVNDPSARVLPNYGMSGV